MNDYIKREDALNASKIVYIEYIEVDDEGDEIGNADDIPVIFKRDLEKLPAADVRENVHGKWEEIEVEYANNIIQYPDIVTMRCGHCKKYHTTLYFYGIPTEFMNFCPVCGAIMDEKKK